MFIGTLLIARIQKRTVLNDLKKKKWGRRGGDIANCFAGGGGGGGGGGVSSLCPSSYKAVAIRAGESNDGNYPRFGLTSCFQLVSCRHFEHVVRVM